MPELYIICADKDREYADALLQEMQVRSIAAEIDDPSSVSWSRPDFSEFVGALFVWSRHGAKSLFVRTALEFGFAGHPVCVVQRDSTQPPPVSHRFDASSAGVEEVVDEALASLDSETREVRLAVRRDLFFRRLSSWGRKEGGPSRSRTAVDDVVLICAREDESAEIDLADKLRKRGYSVELQSRTNLIHVQRNNLRAAGKAIVLWSSHSVIDKQVVAQAHFALLNGNLTSVKIDQCKLPKGALWGKPVRFLGENDQFRTLLARLTLSSSVRSRRYSVGSSFLEVRSRPETHLRITPTEGQQRKTGQTPSVVDVLFATDREVTPHTTPVGVLDTYAGRLSYGVVQVTIPPNHFIGRLEAPVRLAGMQMPYHPLKHVVLGRVSLLSIEGFFHRIEDSGAKRDGVFVFVHGFNTSFENAARRTAQLHFDLRFAGVPVCYSWCSAGKLGPLEYNRDREQSDVTATHLRQFLDDLAVRSDAACIHVVAHSMGNRALVEAVNGWAPSRASPLNHIVLVAPDVGRDYFSQVAQAFQSVARRTTLYGSRHDQALRLSRRWAGDVQRAGDSNPPIVLPPMETIDVSEMDIPHDPLNHFVLDDDRVIDDMKSLFDANLPVERRMRLREMVTPDGHVYWRMVRR